MSLYFSYFSTILYGIYNFAAFDSSVHVSFSLRPLGFCFFSGEVPGGSSEQSRERARRFPARRVTGGEGKVGENGEGLESYPWVVVGGAALVGAGLSTARGGRWRDWAVAALLRQR